MNRRKFIISVGAGAAGGSTLLGSGAFASASAKRDIAISVAGDSDAFLRLGPCTDDKGDKHPNGKYVVEENGLFGISLSEDNDAVHGSGVNNNAITKFYNVFEICNQGTQPVCLNFSVDVEPIPGPVPGRYSFEEDDAAVVFYEGSDESAKISVEDDDPGLGKTLDVGECLCVGFNVRAFGFDTGEDLFEDAELSIIADAGVQCSEEIDSEPDSETQQQVVYGTSLDDPRRIIEVTYDGSRVRQANDPVTQLDASGEFYPNGLGYDADNETWYFSDDSGTLERFTRGDSSVETAGKLEEGATAGACFHKGRYFFITQGGGDDLKYVEPEDRMIDDVVTVHGLELNDINLGDLAIDRENDILYISAQNSDSGEVFYEVELGFDAGTVTIEDQREIRTSEGAVNKQLAFVGETLLAHDAESGEWWEVDTDDGSLGPELGTTDTFSDLSWGGVRP